ncbi:hypothetical protein PIB30_055839 [Stylosanthes scabra]|uniref:F-box domain-containing protein n=1 Tax=Stylosanthes scabra TaxID=79078 RepID=A0ABU6YGM2_9FABA|nr:hypothetical protein [Stylosanthes scabra]
MTNTLQSITLIENHSKSLFPSKQPFIADLVFDMVRLLVRSLQRFRSTCKTLNALISSNYKFSMEQLRRVVATRCNCHYLLVYIHSFPDKALTSYLRYYSLTSAFSTSDGSDTYFHPNGPFAKGDWLHFNGNSCHGLVLVTLTSFKALPFFGTQGKFKILPQIKKYPMDNGSVHTGLGYDPFVDSYKVIKVSHSKSVNTAMVLIVGRDLRREIKNFHDDFPRFNMKFMNDTPNWLVKRNIILVYHPNSSVIVSLDMGRKEFHEASPPMNVIGDLNLSLLKDWLCIVGHRFINSDVWDMKEYGKDDENRVMLLRNKSKFAVHDPKTGTFSAPAIQKF